MNKAKRKRNGQFAERRSPAIIGLSWIASFISLLVPYATGRLLLIDLAAFRPCSTNNNGLHIVTCGKRGINAGDLLFLILFGLSVALTYSLFTAAWRMTSRKVTT